MNIKKITSVIMASLIVLSYTTPTLANTQYKNSIGSVKEDVSSTEKVGNDESQNEITKYKKFSEDSKSLTDVYLTQTSTFSVTAPVIAVIGGNADSNGNYKGDVKYSVKGNIATNEKVVVSPDTSFKLSQTGKNDIDCTVKSKGDNVKTEFTYADGMRRNNELSQEYTLSTKDITAGSWHGTYNTNIYLTGNDVYYSSIEKAVEDANALTVDNADISTQDSKTAKASVFIENGKAYVTLMSDISDANAITFSNDTVLDLHEHKLTFSKGNYVKYDKSLTIRNGKIEIFDSKYGVYSSNKDNNTELNIDDVTIYQNISENINATSFAIAAYSHKVNANDLAIIQSGKGHSSYNSLGFGTGNSNEGASCKISNYTFKSNLENTGRIRASQFANSTIINGTVVDVKSVNGSAQGFYTSNVSQLFEIHNAKINVHSDTNTSKGIYSQSYNNIVENCNVFSDDNSKQSAGTGSAGAIFYNSTTENEKAICEVENCTIFGKQWGLQTPAYGITTIKDCNISATNHNAYILGNTDIYNSTIKIAGRENYSNNQLDACYGLYCGNDIKSRDKIVNFHNCKIGNPTDTSGKNVPKAGITSKYNGYNGSKEINVYDSVVYSGINSIFYYNPSNKDSRIITKFNVYGNTKLMKDSNTELTKNQVKEDIDWFVNPQYAICRTYDEQTNEDYKYLFGATSPNKIIYSEFYGPKDSSKSFVYEDYANVYDFR